MPSSNDFYMFLPENREALERERQREELREYSTEIERLRKHIRNALFSLVTLTPPRNKEGAIAELEEALRYTGEE
jgi:hypothetical protein